MDHLKDKNKIRQLISLPIIWFGIVPAAILDLWGEIYHRTCFPLYGLKTVKRSDYIRIDRHKLKYLTPVQKLGCAYCGYINGLVSYWRVIVAKTEKYWCGIRHKRIKNFQEPEHHKDFVRYGDEEEFKERYKE